MTIIKSGDLSKVNSTVKRFECSACGCIWEAEESEYADDGTEKIDSKCGQWVYAHDLAGMRYYRCTNCADVGVETLGAENEVTWWEYCPRCGAKMQIKNTEQEANSCLKNRTTN